MLAQGPPLRVGQEERMFCAFMLLVRAANRPNRRSIDDDIADDYESGASSSQTRWTHTGGGPVEQRLMVLLVSL